MRVQAFGQDELRLMGVTQGFWPPVVPTMLCPLLRSLSLWILLHLCDRHLCAEGRGAEQEHLRRLSRQHRGVALHMLGAYPCCELVVPAVWGAKFLHPASVNCDCKCFLFLSYVS